MPLTSIKKVRNLRGKRVIVRVDFNVPTLNRKVTDNTKLIAAIETINYLRERGARVILISHLGRPEGDQVKGCEFNFLKDSKYTLKIIVKELSKVLSLKVKFIPYCLGKRLSLRINLLRNGQVVLLENVRFYKEEKEGNADFAKKLSSLGDIYVADAFGVSHRDHASLWAIKKYLPSYLGLLAQEETKNLDKLKKNPQKPYAVLLGGSKLSTKIKLIGKLEKKADTILIGGAMANVFLKAKGFEVGRSLVENSMVSEAKKLLRTNKKIIIPKDVVVAQKIEKNAKITIKKIKDVKKRDIILDIGPITIIEYSRVLRKAKSILWNGPMGKFEFRKFSNGSLVLARLIAAVSKGRSYGVCGGGETISVLNKTGMQEYVDWVSTGGGAMLTYLSGGKMPGIK
jgi:phosphoglycerate kinase